MNSCGGVQGPRAPPRIPTTNPMSRLPTLHRCRILIGTRSYSVAPDPRHPSGVPSLGTDHPPTRTTPPHLCLCLCVSPVANNCEQVQRVRGVRRTRIKDPFLRVGSLMFDICHGSFPFATSVLLWIRGGTCRVRKFRKSEGPRVGPGVEIKPEVEGRV